MLFAHDTVDVLSWLAALVNTLDEGVEQLRTPADLDGLLTEWKMTGRRLGTRRELAEVRTVRAAIGSVWEAGSVAEMAEIVNELFADSDARPYLTRHDQQDWHLHLTESEAPLAQRIGAEAALALVDLIRTGETGRLKHCAADDCNAVLIDLSKNHSRRFCDVGNCGNRMHVAAYRRRRAEQS
ncbi:MAG TPA: CGNR zinc finger domain-containing protein [Microlunatus sp.]